MGRSGEDAWVGVGGALDDLWEDVVEELAEHLDWTGAGTATLEDYPAASELEEVEGDDVVDVEELDDDELDEGARRRDRAARWPGVRTIAGGSRIAAARRRSPRPPSSGRPSASCRSRSWSPRAPG